MVDVTLFDKNVPRVLNEVFFYKNMKFCTNVHTKMFIHLPIFNYSIRYFKYFARAP